MSPSISRLTLSAASARSPPTTVVLVHSGDSRVEETTYFGMELSLSANSPSRDGQASANPSYVIRPSSSASDPSVSSSLNWSPSSPRSISNDQPSCR